MHEHLLVYRSQGPPVASRYTFSAFTSMKDKHLRGLCLVSSSADFPPPSSPADTPSPPWLLCASAQLRSRPTSGSDPLSGLIRQAEKCWKLICFPWIPFLPPRLLCHHYRLTCSVLWRPHLNIPLWQHNTSNMPQDTVPAGQWRCSHVPLHERNCCRLPSLTWHANFLLHVKL